MNTSSIWTDNTQIVSHTNKTWKSKKISIFSIPIQTSTYRFPIKPFTLANYIARSNNHEILLAITSKFSDPCSDYYHRLLSTDKLLHRTKPFSGTRSQISRTEKHQEQRKKCFYIWSEEIGYFSDRCTWNFGGALSVRSCFTREVYRAHEFFRSLIGATMIAITASPRNAEGRKRITESRGKDRVKNCGATVVMRKNAAFTEYQYISFIEFPVYTFSYTTDAISGIIIYINSYQACQRGTKANTKLPNCGSTFRTSNLSRLEKFT